MQRLEEDWEFNVLGVYNYRKHGQFAGYYAFLAENHERVPGDVAEVGVFRGNSLLATALLLRELGSPKKVWGFDSFAGFPGYAVQDELSEFDALYAAGRITGEHLTKVKRNVELRSVTRSEPIDVKNISSSGDFSGSSLDLVKRKVAYLGLDNVELVAGDFARTMTDPDLRGPADLCAALIDCDLYEGHALSLPYVWSRLRLGGYLHLDEYYSLKFPGARLACDEFFADKRDKPERLPPVPGEFERWCVRRSKG